MRRLKIVVLMVSLLATAGSAEPTRAQQLFQQNCQLCHGDQGRGDGVAAQALPVPPRDLTQRPYRYGCGPGAVARTIRSGLSESGMPAFGEKLSEEEIWTLSHYVRGLQKSCCQK